MIGSNLVFLVGSLLFIFRKRFRHMIPAPAGLIYLAGNIWLASIAQTFMDHGDNPRFLVPLQSLVLLCVLWFAWTLGKTVLNRQKE